VSFILADSAFIDQAHQLFGEIGLTVMGFLSPSMGESLLLVPLRTATGRRF
jgi:hypothetical protein